MLAPTNEHAMTDTIRQAVEASRAHHALRVWLEILTALGKARLEGIKIERVTRHSFYVVGVGRVRRESWSWILEEGLKP